MALIKCPECGKEISDKAPACIHCGYPIGAIEERYKEELHSLDSPENDLPYEEYNILEFDYADRQEPYRIEYEMIKFKLKITNTSPWMISDILLYFYLRDGKDNVVGTDERFFDVAVYPGTWFFAETFFNENLSSVLDEGYICIDKYQYRVREKGKMAKKEISINTVFKTVDAFDL